MGVVQRINLSTYKNGDSVGLLFFTRQVSNLASNLTFADKLFNHMALHVSLTCQRPHPERK